MIEIFVISFIGLVTTGLIVQVYQDEILDFVEKKIES